MVLCLVTLTDLQTRRAGLSASAELLVWSQTGLVLIPAVPDHITGWKKKKKFVNIQTYSRYQTTHFQWQVATSYQSCPGIVLCRRTIIFTVITLVHIRAIAKNVTHY